MGITYEDVDSGAIFRVSEPRTSKQPTFTGGCTIDGRRYRIAGKGREIQKGEQYLKLKFTLDEQQPKASRPAAATEDNVPF